MSQVLEYLDDDLAPNGDDGGGGMPSFSNCQEHKCIKNDEAMKGNFHHEVKLVIGF